MGPADDLAVAARTLQSTALVQPGGHKQQHQHVSGPGTSTSTALATDTALITTALLVPWGVADAPPNASACASSSPAALQQNCSLRSAVELCKSVLTDPLQECFITLQPAESEGGTAVETESACVQMDPALGELLLVNMQGRLRIHGDGCTISPLPSAIPGNSSRLFRVQEPLVRSDDFTFMLANATIAGFGSLEVDGGAIYVDGMTVVIEFVVFRDNYGDAGGAMFVDQSTGIRFLSTRFEGNTAASDGGGVYLDRFNTDIQFLFCDFIGNTVTGNGFSRQGTTHSNGMARYSFAYLLVLLQFQYTPTRH